MNSWSNAASAHMWAEWSVQSPGRRCDENLPVTVGNFETRQRQEDLRVTKVTRIMTREAPACMHSSDAKSTPSSKGMSYKDRDAPALHPCDCWHF